MSPHKFAKLTSVRNLVGMLAVYVASALVVGLVANAIMGGCSSARRVGPKIINIGAEECVEIAKEKGDSRTEKVCATIDDLVPFLDQILALQQAKAAGDEEAAAAAVAPPAASSGGQFVFGLHECPPTSASAPPAPPPAPANSK
jgi:hypothetical protein